MKRSIIICLIYFIVIITATSSIAQKTVMSAISHVEKGNTHLIEDRPFAAIEEFRTAIQKGANDPVLFRNLAIVLYDLGFMDEAIVEMKTALDLSPYAISFQMELGIIFLAQGNLDKAKDQFLTVLERNPGFADAYYYLGEIFFRKKDYDTAWMFARMAQRLNHKGTNLIIKLDAASDAPNIDPWVYKGDKLFIRQILVDTQERAEETVARIKRGDLGHFSQSELHPNISRAISNSKIFSDPVIVQTELGFHIVQRIVPFDFNKWQQMIADYTKTDKPVIAKVKKAEPVKIKVLTPSGKVTVSKTTENIGLVNEKKIMPSETTKPENPPAITQTLGNTDSPAKFLIFVGAFKEEPHAIARVEKLRKLGHPSYHFSQQSRKGPLFMVIAGKYKNRQQAQNAGKGLAEQGFEYFISRQ
jgi:cell division septation protein DedD